MKSSYIKLLSIILISCVGIIVYSNTFHCSFHFDDATSITDNFAIRNIHDLQSIWNFWPCRFITYLSIAFNYHFNGLDVFGYHLFNLGVHLVSAILVWWFILLTLSTPAMKEQKITQHADLIALFAGLVFVSHPIQTQAVTYIVQRATSMSTLFYVASLCFYAQSRLSNRTIFYTCSLIAAIAAMFTKEMAITLPLMILLYEFSFFKTKKNFNWGHSIPFLLTLFIIPLTMLFTKTVNFQEMHRVTEESSGISSMQYLSTQFRVMATYIRLVFLPFNQNVDYNYPILQSLFELPTLISLLFLSSILFFAKRLFSKYRLVSFSIFWFFLALLPESSFIPIKDVIFEHRLYLPLVGYSLFLVSGVYYLFGKNTIKTMVIVLTMIIACNSVLTYQRNKVWKDEFTLWDDAFRKFSHNARVYNNRGLEYYNQGKSTQAMSDFNKAIEIDPNLALAYNNRGSTYGQQGNVTQAILDYNKAIEINPNYADAYSNRGSAYGQQGNVTQAILDYNKAIEINPNYADAYGNRGNVYYKQGNFTQAMSDCNKAIELNPYYAEAYNNRGNTYDKQGNFTQALFDFNKVIEINPKYAEAYNNRGVLYYQQGNFTQAILDYNKAIGLNPKYEDAYNNRGNVYNRQGNFTQAILDYNKVVKINPHYGGVYINRGSVYYQQGNFTKAISDYTKAISMDPNFAEAYYARGNAYDKQGNSTQALSDYNKAIEINPQYAPAYNNRAILYYRLKEYDKAWVKNRGLKK